MEKKKFNIEMGRRIKDIREISGYTQEKFAEGIGVSVQYISDLERGKVGTSIPTLCKICTFLNASSDYIILGRENTNDISKILDRLKHLSPDQLAIVEKGINILLMALDSCPQNIPNTDQA